MLNHYSVHGRENAEDIDLAHFWKMDSWSQKKDFSDLSSDKVIEALDFSNLYCSSLNVLRGHSGSDPWEFSGVTL